VKSKNELIKDVIQYCLDNNIGEGQFCRKIGKPGGYIQRLAKDGRTCTMETYRLIEEQIKSGPFVHIPTHLYGLPINEETEVSLKEVKELLEIELRQVDLRINKGDFISIKRRAGNSPVWDRVEFEEWKSKHGKN